MPIDFFSRYASLHNITDDTKNPNGVVRLKILFTDLEKPYAEGRTAILKIKRKKNCNASRIC